MGGFRLSSPSFRPHWLDIAAVFDIDKRNMGKKRNGLVVEDIALLGTLKERGINLGITAVPGEAAQNVTNDLIKVGVKAILNFAPRYIEVPKSVKVITIDIALYLARLPYYISSK